MRDQINIRGVAFDNVDLEQALSVVEGFIVQGQKGVVHTPNSEIVQLCVEQPDYYELINSADLIIPDGSGVIWPLKF